MPGIDRDCDDAGTAEPAKFFHGIESGTSTCTKLNEWFCFGDIKSETKTFNDDTSQVFIHPLQSSAMSSRTPSFIMLVLSVERRGSPAGPVHPPSLSSLSAGVRHDSLQPCNHGSDMPHVFGQASSFNSLLESFLRASHRTIELGECGEPS